MGHRNVSNQFMIPGHYQHENNHPPVQQSCIPMVRTVARENGHYVAPMDHMLRGGAHPNPSWHLGGRSDEYHSSNIRMEIQHLPVPYSRPLVDPYTYASISGNTSLGPIGPIYYNVQGISESGGPLKRKTPSVPEGSWNSFYGAGSSSSSQMLIQKPAVDCLSLPPYRGSNLSINGQDSMRNVRSRSGPELEPCMTRAHVPSYASQYYQPTTDSVPVHPVNISADVAGREWNSVPYPVSGSSHGRILPPDINGLRHERNHFYAAADINACHQDPFFRRNPHVSYAQPSRDGHNYHYQRGAPSHRNGPTYSSYTHGGSSTYELQFLSDNFSSRYSRQSPADCRPRISVDRLQPTFDVMDYHDEFGLQTITVDQLSFYHDPGNFPDQYQDMRLDIDSMSYEELLALEESIGYVSTGLSENVMSKCLREKIYYSMNQNHEEATCCICLEEYKNGEKVGRMEKCGHEYHVDCIKKWLVMKKVCPICKSDCSTQ